MSKRLLLVEDTADLRVIAKMSLELGGYEVTAAGSGAEALIAVTEQEFDIILLDMMMPEIDGPEVLRRMRDAKVTTPVVFFSAKARPEEIEDAMKLDVRGYITKPFDPMGLAGQVDRHLKKAG
ncbi:MAG: response regulator [Planctomycetota bacterium]